MQREYQNYFIIVQESNIYKPVMKKINAQKIIIPLIGSAIIFACNPLKKMEKKYGTVSYEVTPSPAEMHGDSVSISVTGKYPAKFFHKKAIVDATPVMKGADGNVIKSFKTETLVGEAADGEGTKISYAGGSFSYTDKIPYDAAMEVCTVELKATGKFKTKTREFPDFKMADGTIITPLLVQSDDRPILGKDQFQKVIPRSFYAQINYLVNSSNVRSSELADEDIKGMKEFINSGVEKSYIWKNLSISAYASPEGEIALNANLADDRAKSASNSISGLLRKAKIEAAKEETFFKLEGKGEDWDGFKSAMEKSSIQDKDLILKVLKMYNDPDKRESEIKNMAATYTEIADEILPPLRRSQITLNAEEMSKSDAEISKLAKSAPDSLTVEELLYAATLTNDLNARLDIYQKAQKIYPKDWRGANNTGYVLLLQNKVNEAEAEFKKADQISSDNAVVKNNLGVCARWKGDRKTAREYYNSASGAGSDVSYNLGIIDIMDGDYASAVSNFGSQNTFNSSLAKLLNGDNDGAMSVLESSEDNSTAWGYYLKAVIAARINNKDLAINSLKSAFNKDGSLRDKAKRDLEFRNFKDDIAAL